MLIYLLGDLPFRLAGLGHVVRNGFKSGDFTYQTGEMVVSREFYLIGEPAQLGLTLGEYELNLSGLSSHNSSRIFGYCFFFHFFHLHLSFYLSIFSTCSLSFHLSHAAEFLTIVEY